jgi:hypothetical protein
VSIIYELGQATRMNLFLYDMNGKLVLHKHEGNLPAGRHMITIDEELPAGLYTVRLLTNQGVVTRQIIRIAR